MFSALSKKKTSALNINNHLEPRLLFKYASNLLRGRWSIREVVLSKLCFTWLYRQDLYVRVGLTKTWYSLDLWRQRDDQCDTHKTTKCPRQTITRTIFIFDILIQILTTEFELVRILFHVPLRKPWEHVNRNCTLQRFLTSKYYSSTPDFVTAMHR